jgi:hypothetical protein
MKSIDHHGSIGKDFGDDFGESCPHINADFRHLRSHCQRLLQEDFNDIFLFMTVNNF